MQSRVLKVIAPILLIVLIASACSPAANKTAEANTLTVVKVNQATLEHDASFWENVPVLEVKSEGVESDKTTGPTVRVQAAYDGDNIVLRAEWADPTASVLKHAWTWDGKAFTQSGDEDRLMIHFPINNDPEFSTKGCASGCHNDATDDEEWFMATKSDSSPLDQWHWKSARTNATNQADDKWLGEQQDPADVESAHHGDEKDGGGEKANANETEDGPAFVNSADAASPFIFAGQEMAIDPSLLAAGSVIPGYVLAPMTGSRGDLSANGVWADGKWVVTIMRALNTGNADDVTFIPPKSVPFGLAVVDDGGGHHHTVVPDVLTLKWD